MASLDDIINQSFQEEQNRYNNKSIKNTESGTVDKLFSETDPVKAECNICSQEDILAVQCFQCNFMYCKTCLGIVISQFSKCSSCSCDFKNSIDRLVGKNKSKQNAGISSVITTSADYDDLDDYELAQLAYLTMQEQNNKNNINTYAKNQSSRTNVKTSNTSDTSNKQNYDQKIVIKNGSNHYYTITNQPNISTFIYTPNNMNLYPIVLNYQLLDNQFQSILDIYLKNLLDKPNKFNTVWEQYALLINNFCNNYYGHNINQLMNNLDFINDKKELVKKIIDLN